MAKNVPVKLNFQLAYSYAEILQRGMLDPSILEIDGMETEFLATDFDDFIHKIARPNKHTLLHSLIENIGRGCMEADAKHCDAEDNILMYRAPLIAAGVAIPKWFEKPKSHSQSRLLGLLENLLPPTANATFYILFSDRNFLLQFQMYVQPIVKNILKKQSTSMKKDGVLKRPGNIPIWLKQAVYFRDRGRCQICRKNLTNDLTPWNEKHMDHMIPLEESGSNDPTNFQLLCDHCNTSKGPKLINVDPLFEAYW